MYQNSGHSSNMKCWGRSYSHKLLLTPFGKQCSVQVPTRIVLAAQNGNFTVTGGNPNMNINASSGGADFWVYQNADLPYSGVQLNPQRSSCSSISTTNTTLAFKCSHSSNASASTSCCFDTNDPQVLYQVSQLQCALLNLGMQSCSELNELRSHGLKRLGSHVSKMSVPRACVAHVSVPHVSVASPDL